MRARRPKSLSLGYAVGYPGLALANVAPVVRTTSCFFDHLQRRKTPVPLLWCTVYARAGLKPLETPFWKWNLVAVCT